MKKQDKTAPGSEELRRRAEDRLTSQATGLEHLSREEVQALVHELQVHQVELEMQNDEIRRTQAELEAALVKCTDLYDFAPTAYLTLDKHGWILEANLTAARLLGTERPQVIQRPLASFILPAEKNKFLAYLLAVVKGQATPPLELNLLEAGGRKVAVQLDSLLVLDDEGTPRVRISLVDITASKQAEEALQELQQRYQTLFNAAGDAIFINDLEGGLLEVNEEACRRLGYTREELLLLTVNDVAAPDDVARRPEFLKQLLDEGHLVFETELITRNGRTIPSECSSRLMDFQSQTAVLSIARDISERKMAEARLRDNETRFRELFDNMSSAVAVYQAVEDDFVLIDHNRTLESIEQVKREDIIGRRLSEVFPGTKDFGLFEVLQRVWRTGAPEHFPVGFYQDERISGWRENYVYRLPSGEVVAVYCLLGL